MNVWYYFVDPRLDSRSKVLPKVKNKMVARYFKVKYNFSTNEARNKCKTSFSSDFDRAIHFLYYLHVSRSSSRSKGQISRSIKQNYAKLRKITNNARNMCNTSFVMQF